jgi:hypothetical protein
VRSRAKDARIGLNEGDLAVLQLATSSAALEQRWAAKRALFPDSDNPVLASLIDRRTLTDEDLLLLAAASIGNFVPAESILLNAERLAGEAGVAVRPGGGGKGLAWPRRDLADELDDACRVRRCGRAAIDSWMDIYRAANRRMPLARLLVVLAIPASDWAEPPHQDYVRSVVSFLERRVLAGIQRGSLVQMRATATVLDVTELRGADLQGRVLDAIVNRTEAAVEVPRGAISAKLVDKLRALESKARTYHRDTGLDALFVGFPFLTLRLKNDDGEKTRIAPVLLWPVALGVQRGTMGSMSIRFDQLREVQLNPALETILGNGCRWQQGQRSVATVRQSRPPGGRGSRRSGQREACPDTQGECGRAGEQSRCMPVPRSSWPVREPGDRHFGSRSRGRWRARRWSPRLRTLMRRPRSAIHFDRLHAQADPSRRTPSAPGMHRASSYKARLNRKSQTIVTVIDCVVATRPCWSAAALDVAKRLAAEQLGHRVFRIENTQSDRATVLRDLQAQVPQVLDARTVPGASGVAKRKQIAAQLDALEADLDAYHEAVYLMDDRLGLTYREVLSLVAQDDARLGDRSAPGLRALPGLLSAGELETVISDCTGLADVWLKGGESATVLEILRPFVTDAPLAARIAKDLAELQKADDTRAMAFAERSRLPADLQSIACLDADALGRWLEENRQALEAVSADVLERAPRWRFFAPASGRHFDEAGRAERLTDLIDKLDRLAMRSGLPGPPRCAIDAGGTQRTLQRARPSGRCRAC